MTTMTDIKPLERPLDKAQVSLQRAKAERALRDCSYPTIAEKIRHQMSTLEDSSLTIEIYGVALFLEVAASSITDMLLETHVHDRPVNNW